MTLDRSALQRRRELLPERSSRDSAQPYSAAVMPIPRRACAVLVAITLGGCGSGAHLIACTLVGCDSGGYFLLPAAAHLWPRATRVRICLDTRCRVVTATRTQLVRINGPRLTSARTVRLSLEVLGRSRRLYREALSATVTKSAPNGIRCGPVCYQVSVAIDPKTKSLTKNHARIQAVLQSRSR